MMKAKVDHEKSNIIVFRVGNHEMGLALQRVRSVEAWTPPTILPRAPKSVLGVIAVRGRIIPVASLKTLLGLTCDEELPHRPKLVVVRLGNLEVALKTDDAIQLMSVDSAFNKSPDLGDQNQLPHPYIERTVEQEGRVIYLIDLEHLLLATAGGFAT